jgi:hypothetical protein
MTYLDELKDEEKMKLIECLREVTEGKVSYLYIVSIEMLTSRMTRSLSKFLGLA